MSHAVSALAAAVALVCAVAAAGCGFGAGPSSTGSATLTVTRDFGSERLLEAAEADPPSSETVIRFLDGEADITTRYGGGFVQSINGISGGGEGGGSDWFFYVNGIESPVGAAEVQVKGGDRIWWDYRRWTAAMRVPAVVGSWPEPFAQASADSPVPVRIYCFKVRDACSTAAARLADAGVDAAVLPGRESRSSDGRAMRVLVGSWRYLRGDPAVGRLGPQDTGVFATFKGPTGGPYGLVALDAGGAPASALGPSAGLVAALHLGDDPPTWIVTGWEAGAVRRAAGLLDEDSLRDRYAVASVGGREVPIPVSPRKDGSL
jgi:hypothetical protein